MFRGPADKRKKGPADHNLKNKALIATHLVKNDPFSLFKTIFGPNTASKSHLSLNIAFFSILKVTWAALTPLAGRVFEIPEPDRKIKKGSAFWKTCP